MKLVPAKAGNGNPEPKSKNPGFLPSQGFQWCNLFYIGNCFSVSPFSVIPAKAGILFFKILRNSLDSGFHRSDDFLRDHLIEQWAN